MGQKGRGTWEGEEGGRKWRDVKGERSVTVTFAFLYLDSLWCIVRGGDDDTTQAGVTCITMLLHDCMVSVHYTRRRARPGSPIY